MRTKGARIAHAPRRRRRGSEQRCSSPPRRDSSPSAARACGRRREHHPGPEWANTWSIRSVSRTSTITAVSLSAGYCDRSSFSIAKMLFSPWPEHQHLDRSQMTDRDLPGQQGLEARHRQDPKIRGHAEFPQLPDHHPGTVGMAMITVPTRWVLAISAIAARVRVAYRRKSDQVGEITEQSPSMLILIPVLPVPR